LLSPCGAAIDLYERDSAEADPAVKLAFFDAGTEGKFVDPD
jgi:hypothetical protein